MARRETGRVAEKTCLYRPAALPSSRRSNDPLPFAWLRALGTRNDSLGRVVSFADCASPFEPLGQNIKLYRFLP